MAPTFPLWGTPTSMSLATQARVPVTCASMQSVSKPRLKGGCQLAASRPPGGAARHGPPMPCSRRTLFVGYASATYWWFSAPWGGQFAPWAYAFKGEYAHRAAIRPHWAYAFKGEYAHRAVIRLKAATPPAAYASAAYLTQPMWAAACLQRLVRLNCCKGHEPLHSTRQRTSAPVSAPWRSSATRTYPQRVHAP